MCSGMSNTDKDKLDLEFFLPMIPPTATAQEHQVDTRGEKPRFYDPPRVAEARAKLEAHLAQHVPPRRMEGGIRLVQKWIWPCGTRHRDGEYKITKPDKDNLEKLLDDAMTRLGYWKDDAQVCSGITEKFWGKVPGIYIRVTEL